MAQDYGAAQPIMDWVQKTVYDPVEKIGKTINKVPLPAKQDTSWHDDMVRKANQSFRTKSEDSSKTRSAKPAPRKPKPYKTAQ